MKINAISAPKKPSPADMLDAAENAIEQCFHNLVSILQDSLLHWKLQLVQGLTREAFPKTTLPDKKGRLRALEAVAEEIARANNLFIKVSCL